jgi:hypothetical protein
MHPRQASVLAQANDLVNRLAAKKQTEKKQQAGGKTSVPVLWKYTDPDSSQDFYLTERKNTVKSPYSGKSFSAKPEKFNMGDVTKELKTDAKAEKAK